MTLGERIKRLRQERNWSQAQLAQRLDIHQKQVSGYERHVHVPSVEVLIRLAELLDVSLDYLAFDDREEARNTSQIADLDLLRKMEAVDKLPEADKVTIKAVLDSFILKSRFQQLAHVDEAVTAR
ncbi:helix-turn-helix transcriptional regulator [Ketobacter sp. MCCC 1A13808]|uniref:helix-turn-helix domain-containing protein n=1 Tax=Ketobacter sp. MCCC 1A13808 TaxID=2602738 RepID=UPI0012EBA3B6|nr:helix-turn-helix transcriptional regulator [Ketobacter sp. MCCC 1A13808]MVF14898.1 helix-turn-helix transcriptional regulator [Ketobacter sp. MCCC 1A13808]